MTVKSKSRGAGGERLALFGGTFNPVHMGHLVMAEIVREKFGLDRVVFVPAAVPPHKRITHLASAQDRYQMVKRSIRGNPCFSVSDYEVKKGGKSFSIHTVRYFQRRFPEAKLYFIIGQDSYPHLSTWKDIGALKEMVTFVVVNRPGYRNEKGRIRHRVVTVPGIDLSSSYIRSRVRSGCSIRYLVPGAVEEYIRKNKIYVQKR